MSLTQRIRGLWSWWYRGAYDQAQLDADSSVLQEYDDLCRDLGRESPEARELEPQVVEIRRRRHALTAV